jgi:hypothetical protein
MRRRLMAAAPRWLRAIVDEVASCPAGMALVDLLT